MKCQRKGCSKTIVGHIYTGLENEKLCQLCNASLNLRLSFSKSKLAKTCKHWVRRYPESEHWYTKVDGTRCCTICEEEQNTGAHNEF